MFRPAPRLHRLPQRLDYTLIPAPLDLSLEHMSEKSPLPAIIVTPSSPSGSHFSIAFLAPPPKPTLSERVRTVCQNVFNAPFRTRTLFGFIFIFLILSCHYLAHRFAVSRHHLEFFPSVDGTSAVVGTHTESAGSGWFSTWFDFSEVWNTVPDGQMESPGDSFFSL
ncbi:hypothetical protein JOM56_008099 [Amanita muscaria]